MSTNYRFYMDIRGSEHHFEWRNATEGGVVFWMTPRSESGVATIGPLTGKLHAFIQYNKQNVSLNNSTWSASFGVYSACFYNDAPS